MSREYDKNELIHPGERLDDLQTGGYYLIQDPSRFCFGIDAVLLSSFARVKRGEKALDLGTGTGVIPILLESKNQGAFYGGLEIQEASADMARRSVQYNDLEQKIEIKTGDIKEAAALYGAASFEVITVNPPYMIGEHGLKNDNEAKYIARHEVYCTLRDVVEQSAKLLKDKGRFYMVHRPFRLPEIMCEMCRAKLEPKRMRLVYSRVDKEPSMVLIEGMKNGRHPWSAILHAFDQHHTRFLINSGINETHPLRFQLCPAHLTHDFRQPEWTMNHIESTLVFQ